MRITRLELHGFKSFADRTVLHLGGGISCVVGPNGCGKSNVVDALKWVIGEQSAKSLRGGEMADVIFAGSADRKPVGYAEVALVLSAEGGEPFPGDWARYAELQVARRLYRSGVSEYLINQTRVRRKDVVDLFMDTGVGNDLYSFIEQGRIDKIVGASTDEVRGLVDEAAGITRYKKRRDEAQSKLDATAGQLDRAADVADEMGRRLKALERQVLAAARFRRVRALLRQDEVMLALAKYQDLDTTSSGDDATLVADRARLAEQEGAWSADQEDLALREAEVGVAQEALERTRDALAEQDARLREAQAAATLHADRARELTVEVERAVAESEAEQGRITEAESALERTRVASDALAVRLLEATAEAEGHRAEEARSGGAERELAEVLRAREGEAARAEGARALVAARLEALEARARELPGRLEAALARLEATEGQLAVAEKRVAVAQEALADRAARLEEARQRRREAGEAAEARSRQDLLARDAVRAAELQLDALQRELAEAVQRAETTAGQAEEEVAARVGRIEQQQDLVLREAERADTERIDALEAEERRSLAVDEASRRAVVEAARREADAALAGWRAAAEADLEAEDARRQAAVEAELAAERDAIDVRSAEGRAAVRERADRARARRDEAEGRIAEAATALRDAEARQALATQRLRVAEGRLAVLEAEIAARSGGDAGARAVQEALGGASPLVEVLGLPEADRDWLAGALGERLWWPVVSEDGARTAARAAREAGFARVVLDPGGDVARALGGAALVGDLDAALAHHRATGGGAVVRGTGERVDADGVVSVGRRDDEGAALAAVDEAGTLRASLAELAAAVGAADGAVVAARAKIEGLRIGARQAATELDAIEQHGTDALERETAAAREVLEQRAKALREARAVWRQEARAALEAASAGRMAEREAADAALRAELAAWLDGRRAEVAARVDATREALRAEADARRVAASAAVEAGRARAWEEVRASTADVAVVRERLKEGAATARTRLDEVRARAERSARELAAARDAVGSIERELAEIEIVVARLEAEREAATALVASLQERLAAVVEEVDGLRASLADVTSRREGAAAELAAGTQLVEAAQAAVTAGREGLARAAAAHAEARAALAAADGRVLALRTEQAGLLATREAASASLGTAGERRLALRERLADAEVRRAEAVRLGREAQASVDAGALAREAAATAWDEARVRLAALRDAREEVARRVRALEVEVTDLRKRVLDAEARTQHAEQERTALRTRIEERYQLDLVALLGSLTERDAVVLAAGEEARAGLTLGDRVVEPVADRVVSADALRDEVAIREAVERVTEHRTQLQRIGEVHLGALDEYRELEARWSELDGQRGDLESSVQSIREAIAKINRTCRERFVETFAQVDAAFRAAYPELVGGGEARLELTDTEDLLETGVEILVRPPGKRLQSLTLLSGGEKAMTAIALLLALFSVKPSPFCVLDEVDAPLDEANGARFNEMLRRMAQTTQFLVVTHNRKTMECADTLYGITMATPGCSSLVSVRVD